MSAAIVEMKAEADRLEWDALYTMKGHYNAAMLWNLAHYTLGISAVLLGVVAGQQFYDANSPAGMVVTAVSAGLTAVITFLKPSERAGPHKGSASVYSEIKRKARMFQNIAVNIEPDAVVLRRELESLVAAYHEQEKVSPSIPWPAYQITRWGVRRGEHTYNEPGEQK